MPEAYAPSGANDAANYIVRVAGHLLLECGRRGIVPLQLADPLLETTVEGGWPSLPKHLSDQAASHHAGAANTPSEWYDRLRGNPSNKGGFYHSESGTDAVTAPPPARKCL